MSGWACLLLRANRLISRANSASCERGDVANASKALAVMAIRIMRMG